MFASCLPTAPLIFLKRRSTTHVVCSLNTTVVLRCCAASAEKITYSWRKEGQRLASDNIKVDKNFLNVTLQSEQDFGTYTCNMTNIAGSTVHQIQLEELRQTKESLKHGKEDAAGNIYPVILAVGGTILLLSIILVIVLACLLFKLKRNRPPNMEREKAPISNDTQYNPSDTRTYMDLQHAAQTYQSLDSSNDQHPNDTYEEVPMTYVNVNCQENEQVHSSRA